MLIDLLKVKLKIYKLNILTYEYKNLILKKISKFENYYQWNVELEI